MLAGLFPIDSVGLTLSRLLSVKSGNPISIQDEDIGTTWPTTEVDDSRIPMILNSLTFCRAYRVSRGRQSYLSITLNYPGFWAEWAKVRTQTDRQQGPVAVTVNADGEQRSIARSPDPDRISSRPYRVSWRT